MRCTLIGTLSYVSRLEQFLVKTVVISGNTVTDGALIEDVARGELSREIPWLFSKRKQLLVSGEDG